MNIVVRKLVAKELYVNRWMLIGGSIAAALSTVAATFGQMAFNLAALTWLTTIIALGVMLAIYGVQNERKENSLQFVLSLPLSVREYVSAKIAGLALSFLGPWLVATLSAVALILLDTDVPDGLLTYVLALCGFLLVNFSLVVCGAMHFRSESAMVAVIIVTNMLVSVYMFTIGTAEGLRQHMGAPAPVWNSTFFTVVSVEFVLFLVAITLPMATAARRRDFL